MNVSGQDQNDARRQTIERLASADQSLVKAARALREAKVAPEAELLAEEISDVLARVRTQRAGLEIESQTSTG